MIHALALACALLSGDGAPIQWAGRTLRLEALPPELPSDARQALEAWHPWAIAHDARLDLDPDGRVLFVARRSSERAPRLLELATRVVARFDQELPAPAERRVPQTAALVPPKEEEPKPARGEKPLPEDPEDPEGEHPWPLAPPKPVPKTSAPPVITTWGAAGQAPDTGTAVVFLLFDEPEFEALLVELGQRFAHLEPWTHEAKALQGFVLGDPLVAAYLETPAGVEEWNADNELVNRVARLCLLRRFGELPNWFVQGYAWHMEFALMGAVYVFPWRDEFVWATEHTGWGKPVAERYAKKSLKPADFMGWKRGRYLEPEAKASWAVCEYLLAKEAAKLPDLLERLRVFHEEHARIQDGPSRWHRDVEYEMPVTDQQKLVSEVLGAAYLERAVQFFRKELDS